MGPFQFLVDYIEKARSYIYGIFIFWVVVFSSPVIFTSLFVDQELIFKKTGLLKNEYVRQTFFSPHDFGSWLYLAVLLIAPFFMTWLVIWIFPKSLIKKAYGEELVNQYDREFMKLDKEDELNDRRKKVTVEEEKVIAQEEKNVKRQEDLQTKEQRSWKRDYSSFESSAFYNNFQNFIDTLYLYNGYYGNNHMSPNDLAYVESRDLATINRQSETISLTDKGKYFVSTYQNAKY